MSIDFSNPRDTKFIIIFLQLGEKVWDDFAKGDDHVVSAENREVPDLSAILFDNNKKSRHEPDFEKSNYGKVLPKTVVWRKRQDIFYFINNDISDMNVNPLPHASENVFLAP